MGKVGSERLGSGERREEEVKVVSFVVFMGPTSRLLAFQSGEGKKAKESVLGEKLAKGAKMD